MPDTSPAPVRIVHLGLGGFHRAHQAWYTQQANDAHPDDRWGIHAFTGRRPDHAEELNRIGLAYTLRVTDADGATDQRIDSIVAASPGTDADVARAIADPAVAIVTLTITEAGYGDTPVVARLTHALLTRFRAGEPGLAVVSCDNLSGNGALLRRLVTERAEADGAEAAALGWLAEEVSFVDTMVDRITPSVDDPAVVRTEPFTEWVLAGSFPAGRPDWEVAGAQFVDDVSGYEQRKLRVLNAGHTLLACGGLARGLTFVHEAIADPQLRQWLDDLWDEAAGTLPMSPAEIAHYRADLIDRFANPSIRHELAKIVADSSHKLRQRTTEVVAIRLAEGLPVTGELRSWALWLEHLRTGWTDQLDPAAAPIAARAVADLADGATAVVEHLAPPGADTDDLAARLLELHTATTSPAPTSGSKEEEA